MIDGIRLMVVSSPLARVSYPALRRAWQISRYGLGRAVTHGDDFARLAACPRREGLFLDVGASSGTSAMSFRVFDRRSPILSIEPNAVLEPELRLVKRIVPRFDYVMTAAGAERGTLTMHVPFFRGVPLTPYSATSRAELLCEDGGLRDWLGERMASPHFHVEEVVVPVLPLDDLELDPAVVKIDVEGAELGVLRGLSATLERSRPVLLVERSGDFQRVVEFLADRGYRPYANRRQPGPLVPYDLEADRGNVFFLPGAEERSHVRAGRL